MKRLLIILSCFFVNTHIAAEPFCPNGSNPSEHVIFCDSFEQAGSNENQINTSQYFDVELSQSGLTRSNQYSVDGSHSLQVTWQTNQQEAGYLHLLFGQAPFSTQIGSTESFDELYWRLYVYYPNDFVGYPDKLSRLSILASTQWAQAMSAQVWADPSSRSFLSTDPVSGVTNNSLVTTRWNDFANLRWLGAKRSSIAMEKGQWVCVETHVRLNSLGQNNGVFDLYINGEIAASSQQLDWRGAWDTYGLNSLLIGNYWNGSGSPVNQSRFIDALVVSKQPIGCIGLQPNPPQNVIVN